MNQVKKCSSKDKFSVAVKKKADRKQHARSVTKRSALVGLGMFGLIGWSVAVPTLLGIGIGLWLDETVPSSFSWTLALLVAGIFLGCWNAWFWLYQERPENGEDI